MTTLHLPAEDNPAPPYEFSDDEAGYTAPQKAHLVADWQRFIRSGFKKLFFSPELYRFLQHQYSLAAYFNRARFWQYYFDDRPAHLRALLEQVLNDGTGEAADLKIAMSQTLAPLYAPIGQVLADLEQQHAELVEVWYEFALNAGLAVADLPQLSLSRNSREMLAFAIQIALHRPLTGLQLCFPLSFSHPSVDPDPRFISPAVSTQIQ